MLWGKAKDIEEIKKEMCSKLQNDQSTILQLLIDESSEKQSCKADVEEPLHSHISVDDDEK